MSTLKGIFCSPKPIKRNFIQENVRQLREVQKARPSKTENESVQRSIGKLSSHRTQLNVPSHHINSAKVGSKSKPDPQDKTRTRITRSDQLVPVQNGVGVQIKPTALNEPKLKQTRKVQAVVRAKKEAVDAELMKENDVAKYVRQQRASILHKSNMVDSQHLSGSELSLDLSGESVELGSPIALSHRTTGSQTIDPKNLDTLYSEGVIRYPSTHKNTVPINVNRPKPKLVDSSSQATAQKESVDFVQTNVATVASVPHRFPMSNGNPMQAPPTYQKGVVPKYLQKRQVEWQKESDEVQKNTPDPACPPGHVPLPETERKETLKMIRKSHADYVHELNMMPVRTDTLRMRQRKMELEKQLNKLEEGIKVFSRPKVFVKIGE